nr:hypothetical protein [Elizabethkingia sp. ASV34]
MLCKDKDNEVVKYALNRLYLQQWLQNSQHNYLTSKYIKKSFMTCLRNNPNKNMIKDDYYVNYTKTLL